MPDAVSLSSFVSSKGILKYCQTKTRAFFNEKGRAFLGEFGIYRHFIQRRLGRWRDRFDIFATRLFAVVRGVTNICKCEPRIPEVCRWARILPERKYVRHWVVPQRATRAVNLYDCFLLKFDSATQWSKATIATRNRYTRAIILILILFVY